MDRRGGNRDAILTAADRRIAQFGFKRTTIADIARDCHLSPAHIYNFFSSKLDLAAAIEKREDADIAAAMVREAGRHKDDCAAALRAVVLKEVRAVHRRFDVKPGAVDLMPRLTEADPDFATHCLTQRHAVLASLLSRAKEGGDFDLDNPADSARAIQSATARFRDPEVVAGADIRALVGEADSVIGLILGGLKHR